MASGLYDNVGTPGASMEAGSKPATRSDTTVVSGSTTASRSKMAAGSKIAAGSSEMSVRPKEQPLITKTKRKKKKKTKNIKGISLEMPSNNTNLYLTDGPDTAKARSTIKRLGYTDSEVTTAVRKLKEAGDAVTFDSLIDMAFLVQQQSLEREVTASRGGLMEQPGERPDVTNDGECDVTASEGEEGEDEDEEEDVCKGEKLKEKQFDLQLKKAIENRKSELRAAISSLTFMCRLCNCSRATILLLPCGHLASCDDCLMDVRRCPVARCNKVVRGTKEVFFV